MATRKCRNIYFPNYFMAVRKFTNIYYIPKCFCTSICVLSSMRERVAAQRLQYRPASKKHGSKKIRLRFLRI